MTKARSRVVVVGGGVAGLASAVALGSAGADVVVLERAPAFTEVGAGISLWPNAMRALDRLGLGDEVRRAANPLPATAIRTDKGRILATGVATERRFGPVRMIHRADLLALLHSRASSVAELRTGSRVSSVDAGGMVRTADENLAADLIVGADGLRSITRECVLPDASGVSYAGYAAWRLVTGSVTISRAGEMWGRGKRFGYAPLPDRRAYCFAVVTAPEGRQHGALEEIRARFGDWAEPVPTLLDAARGDALLHHDLYELPSLATFVMGKVVLVGDAAHAITPNLGQGAALGLEDAVELADAWTVHDLTTYDRRRRERAALVGRRSARIGAVGQWRSRPATSIRNTLMRLTPDPVVARSLRTILAWP